MTGRTRASSASTASATAPTTATTTLCIADSRAVKAERVWDHSAGRGGRSIVLGVPRPPRRPVERRSGGVLPDAATRAATRTPTRPSSATRSSGVVGDYQVDVATSAADDRDRILAEIFAMTEQHFTVARHLLDTRPWDFFMMVEIGPDRLHHAFWRYHDPAHPRHEPGHRLRTSSTTTTSYLDDEIGELLERFDDDTVVIVVSDHGAQADGGRVLHQRVARAGGLPASALAGGGPTPLATPTWTGRARGRGARAATTPALPQRTPAGSREGIVSRQRLRGAARRADRAARGTARSRRRRSARASFRPEDFWRERRGIPPISSSTSATSPGAPTGPWGHGCHYTSRTTPAPTTPTTRATACG